MAECFPRTTDLPTQSPLFWVTHKDRYLRQLLVRDIEAQTRRRLIVYFTDCDHTTAIIDPSDDIYFAELLRSTEDAPVDLLLETNGGMTDATEKLCSLLRTSAPDLRVIVPRRAKSNGTVIALCGSTILLGPASELGPIDPIINNIPVEFILGTPSAFNPIDLGWATSARSQTIKLAKHLLSTGMMRKELPEKIESVVETLATKNHFHSHGSVMDAREATALGLSVEFHADTDPLWQQLWLLRTMYAYDCGKNSYSKLFESATISSAVTTAPAQAGA